MLDQGVQFIKGIGPKKAAILRDEAGIETVEDLLYYAPRRYLDRSSFKPIRDCFVGETVTVAGTIRHVSIKGRRRSFLEVAIDDGSDMLLGVFFRGLGYFQRIFKAGEYVLFSGRIDFFKAKQIVHPEYDFLDEDSSISSIHTGRIVPLYPSTEKLRSAGLDSRGFRRILRTVIDEFVGEAQEPLDPEMIARMGFPPLRESLVSLHFPESLEAAERARRRLSFDELFFMQYYLALTRRRMREEPRAARRPLDMEGLRAFTESLPFPLTVDQKKAIEEIASDLAQAYPMSRLLQGDVGAGKTVVAMAAALLTAGRGEQTAVMAPTEILAQQHFDSFRRLLPPAVRLSLITGGTPGSEKATIRENASRGAIDILIGTHALIQDEIIFKRLGLIVIDEQHRFGVSQRAGLRGKGEAPDLLIMTATPIPRSLSLTLYGDLDVTAIREKPAGRQAVKTMLFPQSRLKGVYNSIEKYIQEGRQVYYVLPLIEQSEKLDLKSATEIYTQLKKGVFANRRIELLHGRIPAAEKEEVMRRFKDGEIDILVSTTVIEVGVDVPNASIMVIEHPERFGLSQLHQLRGRVARGSHQSFCVLVHPDELPEESRRRIEAFAAIDDGFRIAEEDLRLRGSGEIIGMRQHGRDSGFEFADPVRDMDLILRAREEAERLVSSLDAAQPVLERFSDGAVRDSALKGFRGKRVLALLS